MARPIWFVNLVKRYFPSRFALARLTKVSVVGRMIDYGLFEGDDIIYLPKDDAIQINEPVSGTEEAVLPSQLVDHFIGEANYHGLVHLIGRNNLDSVWLGANPGHKLLTICNCCPRCCLWKMLPHIDPSIGCKISKMPSVSVTVTDECVGCGLCAEEVCFVDAIAMDGGAPRPAISVASDEDPEEVALNLCGRREAWLPGLCGEGRPGLEVARWRGAG